MIQVKPISFVRACVCVSLQTFIRIKSDTSLACTHSSTHFANVSAYLTIAVQDSLYISRHRRRRQRQNESEITELEKVNERASATAAYDDWHI